MSRMIDKTAEFDLSQQVELIRTQIRRFDFSADFDTSIDPIISWLKERSFLVDPAERAQLQAVTLLSEYYDAKGIRALWAKSLRPWRRLCLITNLDGKNHPV